MKFKVEMRVNAQVLSDYGLDISEKIKRKLGHYIIDELPLDALERLIHFVVLKGDEIPNPFNVGTKEYDYAKGLNKETEMHIGFINIPD